MLPRIRQVVLVARDLDATCAQLERDLELKAPFHDPGVAEFGLHNSVYELGDTFVEVVSPTQEGTTAGRYLDKHGGDGGYMVIFQVADTPAARERVAALGVRTVWQMDLDDISGTHLHPRDVPCAIVSLDTPQPPESWRWAGPRWTGGAPDERDQSRGVTGITVRAFDPNAARTKWTAVLDDPLDFVTFEPAPDATDEGMVVVQVRGLDAPHTIAGVQFEPAP